MLPSAHRLRRPAEFGRTVRGGARAGRDTLVVHLLVDDEGDAAPQVGFVVSKAVGNAVQRNLVKRRLREIARAMMGDPGNNGFPERGRVVVRALPAASRATFAELRRDLTTATEKAVVRVTRSA
ncbi:ribonuclease P protein component [Xylanimonas allomyrinae]|uniref:Ribonuclease P protein component n=1 Tax=Xylanimonas allomyrinae TaxID=2509459 RepID=A0A4P6EQ85_9MICO|nr:ribonuclease P protein component [Xylanimonas allomyrinae]QAY63993.1 ribonuclease P protein component [Xylanimonas allomyrinae]